MDESTLRAKNIPDVPPPKRDVPVFGDPRWLQKVNNPRCRECGTSTSKPNTCFFCGEVTCPKCTRQETWGGIPRKVCKGCREAGKEVEADIGREEQAYERKGN
jgi:hypothetical protein